MNGFGKTGKQGNENRGKGYEQLGDELQRGAGKEFNCGTGNGETVEQ